MADMMKQVVQSRCNLIETICSKFNIDFGYFVFIYWESKKYNYETEFVLPTYVISNLEVETSLVASCIVLC